VTIASAVCFAIAAAAELWGIALVVTEGKRAQAALRRWRDANPENHAQGGVGQQKELNGVMEHLLGSPVTSSVVQSGNSFRRTLRDCQPQRGMQTRCRAGQVSGGQHRRGREDPCRSVGPPLASAASSPARVAPAGEGQEALEDASRVAPTSSKISRSAAVAARPRASWAHGAPGSRCMCRSVRQPNGGQPADGRHAVLGYAVRRHRR
jgi:hypothetical protein